MYGDWEKDIVIDPEVSETRTKFLEENVKSLILEHGKSSRTAGIDSRRK